MKSGIFVGAQHVELDVNDHVSCDRANHSAHHPEIHLKKSQSRKNYIRFSELKSCGHFQDFVR
jgi:hypothetical protein